MSEAFNIIWLRNDLRLHDNPAFELANQAGLPVAVVFIVPHCWISAEHSDTTQPPPFSYREPTLQAFNKQRLGNAKARFLRASLIDLQRQLYRQNIQFQMVYGDPVTLFGQWQTLGLQQVFTQQAQAPEEQYWLDALAAAGIRLTQYNNQTLFSIEQLQAMKLNTTAEDWPASFSGFRRRVEKAPECRPAAPTPPVALQLDEFELPRQPSIPWPTDFSGSALASANTSATSTSATSTSATNTSGQSSALPALRFQLAGGEDNGLARLSAYLWQHQGLQHYKHSRNELCGDNVSSLFSAYLAWGCVSARRVWHDIECYEQQAGANEHSQWLKFELLWREYFHWCLRLHGRRYFRYQGLMSEPLTAADHGHAHNNTKHNNTKHNHSKDQHDSKHQHQTQKQQRWHAWQQARTGVPAIDAGLRELINSGYCSNRMRQWLASYFIHELQLDWRLGAQFFETHLLDFDVAINWGNWAYLAGVGNDPQGQNGNGRWFSLNKQLQQYDPQVRHIQQWLPSLQSASLADIQAHSRGDKLIADYPQPLVAVP